jgi:pyruvate dehydrogenase E1 component subunit alpha
VDGDDLEAMLEASDRLLTRAREERRPAVLEAMTYRYRGHSVADAGIGYRSKEEIEARRSERDPIRIIADRLRARGELSHDEAQRIEAQQRRRVEQAVAFATASRRLRRRRWPDTSTPIRGSRSSSRACVPARRSARTSWSSTGG